MAPPRPDRPSRSGIHTVTIPTPFAVGPVNAYVIDDEPLTVVDPGPGSAFGLQLLEAALDARGRRLSEVGLVIMTHHHLDHFGLAEVLVDRSGAALAGFAGGRAYFEDFGGQTRADNAFAERLMRRHGVAPDLARLERVGTDAMMGWGRGSPLTLPLADGDSIQLRDRRLTIHHRPGHSPTDIVLLDRASATAFTGDHLIGHISPNPLITRPLGDGTAGRRPSPLLQLRDSLRKTAADRIATALPGHGGPVAEVTGLAERRLASHLRRAEQILALLESRSLTAHGIAHELWGRERVSAEVYLTLCEVLGHLALLESQGRVSARADEQGWVRFGPTCLSEQSGPGAAPARPEAR